MRWKAAIAICVVLAELAGRGARIARAADADLVFGAAAGAIQPLRGINIGPLGNVTNPSLTSAYQDRGVNLIRTHDYYGPLDMATMYPDRTKNPSLSSSFTRTDYFRLYTETAALHRANYPSLLIGGPAVTPAGYWVGASPTRLHV